LGKEPGFATLNTNKQTSHLAEENSGKEHPMKQKESLIWRWLLVLILAATLVLQVLPAQAKPLSLAVGQCAKVVKANYYGGLAVRSAPGAYNPLLKRIPDGMLVKIEEGPRYVNGIAWWKHDQGGWSSGTYLAYTTCPASNSTRLIVGIEAGHSSRDPGALSCDRRVKEADITFDIANRVASKLRARGIEVIVFRDNKGDFVGKRFDAFIALHVDWCASESITGYKVARYGGLVGTGLKDNGDASDRLAQALWNAYGPATRIVQDHGAGHYTNKFLNYYALGGSNAVSSATPAAIIEMGWMSRKDLAVLRYNPDKPAEGIAQALLNFLGR
jgi:N-acetylmuramoyl-L-alanine amidase